MTDAVRNLIEHEAKAAEQAEEQDAPARTDVTVSRGHGRSRTLQIRLNVEEYEQLEALAATRDLPVSTVARSLLLSTIAPADDLQAAFERLERDLMDVRRQIGA